jgi:hypothetical protein
MNKQQAAQKLIDIMNQNSRPFELTGSLISKLQAIIGILPTGYLNQNCIDAARKILNS